MLPKPRRTSAYSGVDNGDGSYGVVPLKDHNVPNFLRLDREAAVAEEQLADSVCVDEGFLWIRPVDHFSDAHLGATTCPPTAVLRVGGVENIGWLCPVGHREFYLVFVFLKRVAYVFFLWCVFFGLL